MATTTATYQAFIFGGDIVGVLLGPSKKNYAAEVGHHLARESLAMSRFSASSRANFPRIVNVFSPLHQISRGRHNPGPRDHNKPRLWRRALGTAHLG